MDRTLAAFSPEGKRIIGVLNTVKCVALISHFKENPRGSLLEESDDSIEYEGETEIYWNDQETFLVDGRWIYVDEDYNNWRLEDLTFEKEAVG